MTPGKTPGYHWIGVEVVVPVPVPVPDPVPVPVAALAGSNAVLINWVTACPNVGVTVPIPVHAGVPLVHGIDEPLPVVAAGVS